MFHQRKYHEIMSQASAKHDGADQQRAGTDISERDVKVHKSQYYCMLLKHLIL